MFSLTPAGFNNNVPNVFLKTKLRIYFLKVYIRVEQELSAVKDILMSSDLHKLTERGTNQIIVCTTADRIGTERSFKDSCKAT